MCGRFSQGRDSRVLAGFFGAEPDDDLPEPSYNVAPTDPARIAVQRDSQRLLATARWSFRPPWIDRDAPKAKTGGWINARAERAFGSSLFGPALRTARCVVPADAFYEWQPIGGVRQPFAIGPAEGDSGLLALAGIWSLPASGGDPPGVALLTTTPNELVARIHNRMPVILERDGVDAWLAPDTEPEHLEALCAPIDSQALRLWPVGTAVNNVRADGRELLLPIRLAEVALPGLERQGARCTSVAVD